MIASVPYVDGWVGAEPQVSVVPTPVFPFKNNPVRPDSFSRLLDRDYDTPAHPFNPRIARRTSWTNSLKASEAFDSTDWTNVGLTPTADYAIAPDGNPTMDKVTEQAVTSEHSFAQAVTVTAAEWEFSVFVKGGLGRNYLRLAFIDSAAATRYAFFCFGSAFVGASSGCTPKLVALGDGYFRCVIRMTPAAGSGTFKINLATSGSTISYAGNSSLGAYLWGAQASLGTEDSPYISTTDAARTISAPDRDPEDPFAFLIDEKDPLIVTSERARVRRTFGRIPLQQIVPLQQWIKKPELPGTFPQIMGDAIVVQPEANVPRWVFYTRKPITSDSGVPASTVTGGTYTLSFDGDTTGPIAWNANAATVQTALNALPSITSFGGVTVTGTPSVGFTVTFATYSAAAATLNTSSLVAGFGYASITTSVGVSQGGKVQTISMAPLFWQASGGSAASSFTPAAANPMTWQNLSGGLSYFLGNTSAVGVQATGGTFTLTLWGETAGPFNWNDSTATILAGVNALTVPTAVGGMQINTDIVNGNTRYQIYPAAALAITGGTFTITILGQTTAAIAYNASLATIQSAINALSNVSDRGGVIVSGAGFASGTINFVISFNNIPAMTGNAGSLTPSGSAMAVSTTSSDGRVQTISFSVTPSTVRTLFAAAHGITASDPILLQIGSAFVTVSAGQFSVPDGNTIQLLAASGLINRAGTFINVGKQTGQVYTAESKLTRVQRVTDFYLIGVSPDVDDLSEIPLPAYEGDPASLLAAIFTGDPDINIEVGELSPWRDGPIVQRTRTTLDARQL